MTLLEALRELINEIFQWLDHFPFHALLVNFLSKRGNTSEKSENPVPDTSPIVLLGEVVQTMFLVVPMVRKKGKSKSPIDVVPENLHGTYA